MVANPHLYLPHFLISLSPSHSLFVVLCVCVSLSLSLCPSLSLSVRLSPALSHFVIHSRKGSCVAYSVYMWNMCVCVLVYVCVCVCVYESLFCVHV